MFVTPAAHAIPISDAYVILGNAGSVGSSGQWGFSDGSALSGLRGALTDSANFGPGGVVDRPITIEGYSGGVLDLNGADAFVASWWTDNQTSVDQIQVVTDFFLGGGDLLLFQDSSYRDAFGSSLGLATIDGSSNPTIVTSLLETPFGAPGPVTQSGSVGHFDNSVVASLGGSSCGLNALGQSTIACFAAGAYAPGSGSLIVAADIDLISQFGASYNPENGNGTLGLNLFAFGANQTSAVPEPSTLALLGAGLAVVSIRRRRSRYI